MPLATPLVTGAVDNRVTTPLTASVPAAAALATDQGAMSATAALPHLQMLLKRPAARQAALDALVALQTTPGSSAYRKWLTPAQLASDYGPARADIAKTVAWLQSKGLTVNSVSSTGMSIDFSGTSAAVGAAFGTSIHSVMLAGEQHMAPAATPSIPAALSPVVAGVTLSNFFPKPQFQHAVLPRAASVASGKVTKVGTSYTATFGGTTYYAVTPSDFKTIYDETQAFNGSPFFAAPIAGKGQTIVVAEQTDIKRADWNTFRSTFKLTSFAGTLQFTHPGGCADPGMTPDESEAALDAEWSSSVAPDATVIEASCAGTSTTFGVETTLQNLVELGTPASTISISYGGCEQGNGLTFLQGWENLIEEGASEGISIFVSSGDSGVATCDPAGNGPATAGLAVNGLASNPYDTAVGGTDFQDTALNENSVYWSTTNSSSGGSALSYIPEIPWDNACSNSINTAYVGQTNPIVNCNTVPATASYQNVVGGGGGKSLYYAKPDWQSTSVTGVPNDGVRDLPDISLFAANGFYNHFYLYCMSDANEGGVPCNYKNSHDFLFSAAGGTSFAAPDFAGVAALISQVKGFKVGNIAPRLYQLAQMQFSMPPLVKGCNSSKGNAISAACVFNDVTKGDNSVACKAGTPNCYTNASSTQGIGVSSSTTNKLTTAFPAKQGYSLATGLGTVNITNLLLNY